MSEHVILVRSDARAGLDAFSNEFARVGQYKVAYLAFKAQMGKKDQEAAAKRAQVRAQAAANTANEARSNAQSGSSPPVQQRSGDYDYMSQAQRITGIAVSTWSARCRSGGDAVVSKRDGEQSVCFYRNGGSTRCESIGIETAMRRAYAD